MGIATALAEVVAAFRGVSVGGSETEDGYPLRAVSEPQDIQTPAERVDSYVPEIEFMFGKNRIDATWTVYLIAPYSPKQRTSTDHISAMIDAVTGLYTVLQLDSRTLQSDASGRRYSTVIQAHMAYTHCDWRMRMSVSADGTGTLGPGSLTIGETGTSLDISCLVNNVSIVPDISEGDEKTMLCGTSKRSADTITWAISGNVDVDAGTDAGFFAMTWQHMGEIVPFVYTPNTELITSVAGFLKIAPLELGADNYGD